MSGVHCGANVSLGFWWRWGFTGAPSRCDLDRGAQRDANLIAHVGASGFPCCGGWVDPIVKLPSGLPEM